MDRIKVLHLIDSSGMYGAERVVLTLLENINCSDYHCILGCIRESENEDVELGSHAERLGLHVVYFTMKRGLSPNGILKIFLFIKRNKIQLIHSHGFKPNIYLGLIPKKILKINVISTIHGWAKKYADRKLAVYEMLNCFFIKRFSKCIAVSEGVRQDMLKKGIPSNKIIIIYNGINLNTASKLLKQKEIKKELNIPNDDFVVGTAGRLVKEKGMEIFIKGAAKFLWYNPDAVFLIAGDGPLYSNLKNEAKGLNIDSKLLFVGFVDKIYEYLLILDVFVLSSLTEGLPMILLEAMNAGCPVICSRVGGIPEVINNNINGFLIDSNNPDALSEKLILLYNNPSLKNNIAIKGQEYIKKMFSANKMADEYVKLYDKLI